MIHLAKGAQLNLIKIVALIVLTILCFYQHLELDFAFKRISVQIIIMEVLLKRNLILEDQLIHKALIIVDNALLVQHYHKQ